MITLYQFPTAWGLPNISPFCMKVETYLRMTSAEYKTRVGDPRAAPKGKMPYIDDEGKLVADSELILDHLKRKYGDRLDEGLSNKERALAHVIRRTLEEGFYFAMLYVRWSDADGWEKISGLFKPMLPPVVRSVVPPFIRKAVLKSTYAQGTSRHTLDEIYQIGKADLTAVSTLLGDQKFLLGDEPRSIDACGYGFLANVVVAPFESPIREHANGLKNVVAYVERMKQRYYADKSE
jgi:glutathione S-transferase